jgi:SAM-dependent methyltransferase
MHRRLLPCLLLLLAASPLLAQDESVKPGINDHFKDPDLKKFIGTFEGESREIFSRREAILKACKIKSGMAVADVGAGTGLFTRLFAKEVGPRGKVYAVDIAQKFLDHIKKAAKEAKLDNIETVLCDQKSSKLPANSVDLIFICDTYHHFEFPQRTLATLHKALKPGGQIVLVDFHRIPGKSRKWLLDHVRAGQDVFVKEIETAGFRKVGEEKGLGLKENYFVRFEKVEAKKKTPTSLRFNRDVRPILSDNCFACHGPDKSKRRGDLRLDTKEGARGTVVPGKPDESELIKRLLHDDVKKKMPPAKATRRPTKKQIETIRQWVAEGAKWEPHWAFILPTRPTPPVVHGAVNPIDAFLLERLKKEGLSFSKEAPRPTLIRRLSFDLTGLPPTPAEVSAFINDRRPDAYERLVDRLLASPRFGERMALDWLDSARYADSNGYQSDRDRIMWPWRDWVVRQFNANVPFDTFTVEQIAGDLLPRATVQQQLATGFHRNHPLNGEGGRIAEESRVDYVVDRVDTTATVWLGLTLGCARCHDHKFDPFTSKEYYQLYAFYNSIDESGAVDRGGNANPVLEMATPEQEKKRAELKKEVAVAEAKVKGADAKTKPAAEKELKAKRDALTKFERGIVNVMVMRDRPKPRESHILIRGAYDKYGAKVEPLVIEKLARAPAGSPKNRLALARWLVDPKNPLPARVLANRYWQLIFGTGIVKTAEDFGVQGEPPSHAELLDFLAVEFRDSGWDTKRLIRLMVTSRAYRQSSATTPALREKDPLNRLLARSSRYRLPSLMIRDQALALSGLLVEKIGGPPVKPYQPAGIWEEFSFGFIRYTQDHGDKLYRRALYTFWRRTVAPTNLFDVAARQVCEVKPVRTNTPTHALITLNDVTYAEAHRVLASRVLREGGDDKIGWLFQLATGRRLNGTERMVLARALARLRLHYEKAPEQARALIRAGEYPVDDKAGPAELAAWTGLCGLVLNLDEVITRE